MVELIVIAGIAAAAIGAKIAGHFTIKAARKAHRAYNTAKDELYEEYYEQQRPNGFGSPPIDYPVQNYNDYQYPRGSGTGRNRLLTQSRGHSRSTRNSHHTKRFDAHR